MRNIKCLILILIFVVCLPLIPVNAAPITENKLPSDTYEFEVLKGLSIIDQELEPDIILTRQEFSKILVSLLGLSESSDVHTSYFYDVDDESTYLTSINLLVDMKIVSGYYGGYFRPKVPISSNEMICMLVKACELDIYAEKHGGYPQGYLNAMNYMGIRLPQNLLSEQLSISDASKIIYEFMNAPILELDVLGSSGDHHYSWGETLLESKLNIKRNYGKLVATSITSLIGNSLGEGNIQIDTEIYQVENSNYNNLIGYVVEFYETDIGGSTSCLYITAKKGANEVRKIMSENIDSSSSKKTIRYLDPESNKLKTINLTESPDYIYNGTIDVFSMEKIINKTGDVTLIDNDKDGKFDVIVSELYETYVAGAVAKTDKKIVDKFNTKKVIDLSRTEIKQINILKGNRSIEFDEISIDDVFYYAESSGPECVVTIRVAEAPFEGNVEAISEEYLWINGRKLKISSYYKELVNSNKISQLSAGDDANFYLNPYGEIAYCVINKLENGYKYGFLYAIEKENGLKKKTLLKVLSEDNQWLILELKDKLTINGASGKKAADCSIAAKQLVTYKLNSDGLVSHINTVQHIPDNNDEAVLSQTFRSRTGDVASNVDFPQKYYKKVNNAFLTNASDGSPISFFVNENTKVFFIPKNTQSDSIKQDESRYFASSTSSLLASTKYNVRAYDETSYCLAGAVVVMAEPSADRTSTPGLIVVDKVIYSLVDGEYAQNLCYYSNGEYYKDLISDSENRFVRDDGTPLKRGDIILISSNFDGKVDRISVIKKADEKTHKVLGGSTDAYQMLCGKVVRAGDGYMTLVTENNGQVYQLICKTPKVLLFHQDTGEFYSGDVSDLIKDSYVVLRANLSRVQEVVVYE